MNSLAVSVKVKTMTATIPGKTSGTTARTKAANRLYPSTIACSSMSFGMLLRKPTNSHTDTGMVIVGEMSTSDQVLSWRPTATTSRDSDKNNNVGGTRYTKKIAMAMGPDHGRSSRASAYAAGRLRTKVIATTSRPTHSVFQRNVRNAVS